MPEWSNRTLRIMAQEASTVGELLVEALRAHGMRNVRFEEENGYLEVKWKQLLPTADEVCGLWSKTKP